jgi:bifunctional DNA-binding transcriptional regulator/antitoxin component of YhaV-PrlF toxin-antitoxin module
MKYTTFIAEFTENNAIGIPVETMERLDLRPGDKLEVTITKIKTKRLDILISQNPLFKLLKFTS